MVQAIFAYYRVMWVETKVTGQRRRGDQATTIDVLAGELTLSELIRSVVESEVEGFRQRQLDRQLLQVLTNEQIAAGAAVGKITSGGSELDQEVDLDEAKATAIQAFEDGFYFVFVNGEQIEALNETVTVDDATTMLFVRLTPLAGG